MKMHLQKARRAGGSFLRVTSTFVVVGYTSLDDLHPPKIIG